MIRKILIGAAIIAVLLGLTVRRALPKPLPSSPQAAQSAAVGSAQNAERTISETYHPVIRVIDGDTIAVLMDGKVEKVRLIGLDTPEIVDPRKPVQCFGKESSDKAREILSGKRVRLETDASQGERDRYGRLLAYVFLEGGANFSEMMIAEGYGHEYTYHFPYKYQKEFKEAEGEARESKRGLWAPGACQRVSTLSRKVVQSLD